MPRINPKHFIEFLAKLAVLSVIMMVCGFIGALFFNNGHEYQQGQCIGIGIGGLMIYLSIGSFLNDETDGDDKQ